MARPWDITGDEIQIWSQRVEASSVLPDLVRRLLLATSPIGTLDMRADGGILLGGWDGIVQSFGGTPFCPRGQSVWELSVEGTRKKLDDDFFKRTHLPGASTYVAVLARRFRDKVSWAAERRKQGAWIDVRIFDADDLATWLTQAPAVARWFATHLDKPGYDALDLDSFLAKWQSRTHPPLPVKLVLAGRERERAAEQVRSWARSGRPQPLHLKGDTKEEAILFAAAALAQAPSPEGELWRARTMVVESESTLRWACRLSTKEPLIVLPAFEGITAKQAERTAYVLVPLDHSAPGNDRNSVLRPLALEPMPYRRVAEILIEAGTPPEEAERRAEESGGKLAALQRLYGYVSLPAWATPIDPVPLAAMLLVNAYEPENEADRQVIRALGAEPRDVEGLCERLRIIPDAATVRDHERWGRAIWRWIAEEDVWRALVGSIPAHVLRRFEGVATDILGKDDPRFTLDPNERFAAQVHGKVLEESEAMREGMARSLVRLSLSDEDLRALHGPGRGSALANMVVRRLLSPGWMRWASLADLLPLLAEAAPDIFLERLEESLGRGEEGAAHLLAEEGQFGSPHTGLLWALETLGWSEIHMARVAEALAVLAEYDQKLPEKQGRMANRPAASFNGLLHFAFARTCAHFDARSKALRQIAEQHPNGFSLVVGLLVSATGGNVVSTSRKPQFSRLRPLSDEELEERANQEAWRYLEEIVRTALAHVGTDARRWAMLLEASWRLPSRHTRLIIDALEAHHGLIDDREGLVAPKLRSRLHLDSRGALAFEGADERGRVERLYEKFSESLDPVLRYAWLFVPRPDLPLRVPGNYEDRERKVQSLRDDAVVTIWGLEDRWEQLTRLAVAVASKDFGLLGSTLASAPFADEIEIELFGEANAGRSFPFMVSYAVKRYLLLAHEGPTWIASALRRLVERHQLDGAALIATMVREGPYLREFWDELDRLGEPLASRYWSGLRLPPQVSAPEDWDRAVSRLLKAGNLWVAAETADWAKDGVSVEMVYAVLNEASKNFQRFAVDPIWPHTLDQLFARLESAADVDKQSIVALQRRYLEMSQGAWTNARLYFAAMAESPALFVEHIRVMYLHKGEMPPESASAREERRRHATSAYRILDAWHGYPGEGLGAEAREERLYRWSSEVLDLCTAEGRGDVAAIEVAKVLARAPAAEDGHWPCVAARRLLQSGSFPRLAEGLHTAKYNSRGSYSKSIGEGGKQEREIAEEFESSAGALRADWPRTAAMLDGLARSYSHEAQGEDARAQADLRRAGAEPEDFAGSAPDSPRATPTSEPPPVLPGIVELGTVTLHNIRIIEDMRLDLAPPEPDHGQWVVILGENGSGKTSVLRAIALTLTTYGMAVHGLGDLPADLVGNRADTATCAVRCAGRDYQMTLTRSARETVLAQEPNGSTPRPLVFGYGSERGTIFGGPQVADIERRTSDIDTLFNASTRIYPTFDWLKRQKLLARERPEDYGSIYERLMVGICALLPDVEKIDIHDDEIWAISSKLGGKVPVTALSDGYLTTIGWVVDLVARYFKRLEDLRLAPDRHFFENMTGAVLVDEPDQHLHPRWQMRLLTDIRNLFPRMTFIVTTHNPFTVLGARAEEIWLLERDEEDRITARPGGQRPALMTGSDLYETFFGITTVFPNELGELLDRYSFIARNPVRTDEEDREMQDLLQKLGAAGIEPGTQPALREPQEPLSDSSAV